MTVLPAPNPVSAPRTGRRSVLLALGALGIAGLLPACSPEEPEPVGPAPITEVGAEAESPSGEFTAVIDTAGDSVGVLLRDASGQDIWGDDYGYSRAEPPALLWELEADVLWVIDPAVLGEDGDGGERGSGQGEQARIAPRAEGGWIKEPAQELPEEIAERL